MPGTASTVQIRKKFVHPVCSTMRPVVALASTRGTEMSAVKSANWVAANATLVDLAMNAVSAAVPNPTPRYSNAIAKASIQGFAPTTDSNANPRMLAICTKPNNHNARLIETLEDDGIVSAPQPGSQVREVLDYGPAAPPVDGG